MRPRVTGIISLLHEAAAPRNSAARRFRDRPVLQWTLERLSQSQCVDQLGILCWGDQQQEVNEIAAEAGAMMMVKAPRVPIANLDQISAAQRWSDGWRGGLLGTCSFDRGFHGAFVREIMQRLCPDAGGEELILLIEPAAALVDANVIDAMVQHAIAHPHREFFFTQAAPGLAGVILRPPLLERLAKSNAHPGRLLSYSPDLPGLDPVTNDMCVPVPPVISRTLHRFTLDSQRQINRFAAATSDLNGHLIASDAEKLVAILDAFPQPDAQPREVVLELTTRRAAQPIFAPGTHLELGRGDLPLNAVKKLLDELRGVDDLRLTFAGAGDPLLHAQFADVIRLAAEAKLPALHVETDLLELSDSAFEALTSLPIDIISFHLPAITAATYQRIMGVNGLAKVIDNLKRLLSRKRHLPLVVPLFTKCRENLAEMETWYDHWLRVLGTAVIVGPSDYAGQIPSCAVADMSPPRRRPCARLQNRMTILSDARVPSCEQDILARQGVGSVTSESVGRIWQQKFKHLRDDHQSNNLKARPLCLACREWNRP